MAGEIPWRLSSAFAGAAPTAGDPPIEDCTGGNDAGRVVDAVFARRGRIDDGRIKITVRLGQQVGDLGLVVLLKHDRTTAIAGKQINVPMGRGAGGDPPIGKKREPPHVAIPDLAEEREAHGGERRRIGEFCRVDTGRAELVQIDPINPSGIARCQESHTRRRGRGDRSVCARSRAGLRFREKQDIEYRVHGHDDPCNGLSALDQVQGAAG